MEHRGVLFTHLALDKLKDPLDIADTVSYHYGIYQVLHSQDDAIFTRQIDPREKKREKVCVCVCVRVRYERNDTLFA